MSLDPKQLRKEIVTQMYQKKSLATAADGSFIDLDKVLGDFLDALSIAIIDHIKTNATVDKDAGTIS